MQKINVYRLAYLSIALLFSSSTFSQIQPKHAKLNFSQQALSSDANPANTALVIDSNHSTLMAGGMVNLSASIEYGDLDDLFDAYNKLSGNFEPTEPPPGAPTNPIERPDLVDWDKVFETYPDLEERVELVKDKVISLASLLALIAVEGYAKTEIGVEAPFVINTDYHGGTLLLGLSYTGFSKAVGILENVEFDAEQAVSELQRIPDFTEDDGVQELNLSAGLTMYYNPANKGITLRVTNDSLLLVKSARITKVNLSYSKKWFSNDYGTMYWGAKPTFYNVGMTNLDVRVGDLEDAESLFKDIRNGDYSYENGFDIDLGLSFASQHYFVAAHLKNTIESHYDYPTIDRRRYSSTYVLNELDKNEIFTLERQLTLQGAVFTSDKKWSLRAEFDANPVSDPMLDKYQWVNVTAGYAADNWWLPSARFGFSQNLVGSELRYLNAGITFMKFFNLDIASTLDTVTIDDDKYMRGLNVSLGVQFSY
ncbi:conjugal transfer protein TraF [Thalassotalea eurytherma]|uniref:DUF5723 domain-containing protein n=1 Tax=Thalassotalea eurytherma TaxID=1144278 RepID=A0ABQ6H4L5_9GAMM|nr:conjugal transfer protein TraF [Thalassotalea eurytherma]GLX81767.1 hypothetical protein theurythT_12190 [Thalassotalea eurytherma]